MVENSHIPEWNAKLITKKKVWCDENSIYEREREGKRKKLKWTSDVLMWQFISESAEQEITMPFPFKPHIIKWTARRDITIYFGEQALNSAVMFVKWTPEDQPKHTRQYDNNRKKMPDKWNNIKWMRMRWAINIILYTATACRRPSNNII